MRKPKIELIKSIAIVILLAFISISWGNMQNSSKQLGENFTLRDQEKEKLVEFSETDTTKLKHLKGKIIRILDGDTVEMLYGELPIKLRLEHIDAPEKRGKQPFGNRAKLAISDLCFGQMVKIRSDGKFDRNGRLIGVIFNKDSLNVNKEMVRLGMAWHFKKYSDDMSYDELEREARASKVGLWKDPNPIAPWDYR
ncbi:thermonuclease family protein [Arenibacter sp. M-2]|uniref:thermonuclease family protein n=1 Tax=Arenibacter sp. M-2 TaxID=3053612 RepID=UPI002570C81C|nr:thermonuclease family protein [Arenibacter sp. M-2]MDL5514308.1 thermonuclease family protein [Arenibacter sp. M-2]